MIKSINIILFFFLVIISCNTKEKINGSDKDLLSVNLNSSGDTNHVIMSHRGIFFTIHYYNNKPQSILINNTNFKDSLISHFTKENKGVFLNMDIERGYVNSIGYRYLINDSGMDVSIDSIGKPEKVISWSDYSNNGKSYQIGENDNGELKVYIFQLGEKVDSLLYIKKN